MFYTAMLSEFNDGVKKQANYEMPTFNFSVTIENNTLDIDALNNTGSWCWPWCCNWKPSQHIMFQISYALFLASFLAPCTKKGQLFMHSTLIFAYLLYSIWAWHVICAPDVFTWNFSFFLVNIAHVVYIIYDMRPVKFDPELEEVYHNLFAPFKVSRSQFKRMVSAEFAQIMSLHAGEAYAMQNLTKTDRLGLLLCGKVNVLSGNQFLHPILPCEFLDSPEFESSRATVDEKFKVSIVAASSCRYLYWQRSSLEYLFVKETYLATVITTLIARDITTKLYAMNNKMVTEEGSHLDIRLPSVTGSLTAVGDYRNPPKPPKQMPTLGPCPEVPEVKLPKSASRDRMYYDKVADAPEMEPLTEQPSVDDLPSAGADSWLETSSKYHSCELVDTDDEMKHD